MPSISSYVISMAVYIAFLILMTEGFRRSTLFGLAVNAGLILLLFFSKNVEGWFRWAKDISVLFPLMIVSITRLRKKMEKEDTLQRILESPGMLLFLCIVVAVNIFEASLKDLTMGNWFNGLCGIIMIFCMPFNVKKSWRYDKENYHALIADFTLAWCFLYTTWNACFVYAESPAFVSASLCILLVPELYNFWSVKKGKSNLWLHARIYTLMLHVSIRSFHDVFTPFMDATPWYNEAFKNGWGLVNFILMALYAVYWFAKIIKNRKPRPQAAAA